VVKCRLLILLLLYCIFKNSDSAKYVIDLTRTNTVFCSKAIDPAKTLFSLLIIPKTICANPLARLLLIDCWRCIVFLII
jgi:hypothetical protein